MAIDQSGNTSLTEKPPRFFWVDYEQERSDRALTRHKHSFLKTKHYEARRNKNMQHSIYSCQETPTHWSPLQSNDGIANQANNDENQDPTESRQRITDAPAGSNVSSTEIILSRPPTIRVLDTLPSSPNCRADNPDLYFHYYRYHTSKSCWPIDFHGMSTWFWQQTNDHPALGHVILSTSASQLASTLQLQNASPKTISNATEDAFFFRSQTIKLLQRTLMNTPQTSLESTILIVAHLVCVEAAEANIVAVDAHMRGLKKLVDMAGGLEMLGNKTISTVYCCEVMRGIISCPRPIFEISRAWAARVLSQSTFIAARNKPSTLPLLGIRFFNSPWSRIIHPELMSILQSLQGFIGYYEHQSSTDSEEYAVGNAYLIILMLNLFKSIAECPHVAFQESLRLSTIIYCIIRIWNIGGLPSLAVLTNNLRKSLDLSYSELYSTAPDLLFWILFMGALASQTPTIQSDTWFMDRLAELADVLHLVYWDDAAHLLQGFFFSRSRDTQARCLWESVIRTRRMNTAHRTYQASVKYIEAELITQ